MGETDLAVAWVAGSEIEAAAKVAVLDEHGIRAAVSTNTPSWTGHLSISPTARGASVLVARADLQRAHAVLEANAADSVDLDWDEVDVGAREDDLPLSQPGRMPWAARLGFAVAAALLLLSALMVVAAILR